MRACIAQETPILLYYLLFNRTQSHGPKNPKFFVPIQLYTFPVAVKALKVDDPSPMFQYSLFLEITELDIILNTHTILDARRKVTNSSNQSKYLNVILAI